MGWRRRKAGRPRKKDAKRYPSGKVVNQATTPTDEVIEMRTALFGSAKVQAETDSLICRAWGAGLLTDQERAAGQRLAALIRGRLQRIGAPRTALQPFHDGGRGGHTAHVDDAATLDLEHMAALIVLADLERGRRGVREAVIGAVSFQAGTATTWPLVRYGLAELWKHFDQPRNARLARVRDALEASTASR